jgi:hypothetical protein
MNTGFPYDTLDGVANFRLLKLLPGGREDPIVCVLLEVSTSDSPPYEALSYAWWDDLKSTGSDVDGPGLDAVNISLDGQAFAVSVNLFFALANFRHRLTARMLWIDAICVNQMDIPERNAQVAMMRSIYGNSIRTLVWLGMGDEWTTRGIKFIPRLAKVLQVAEDQEATILDPLFGDEAFSEDLLALAALLKRPWFSRIWVIQEVAVARDAMMFLGRTDFDEVELSVHLEYLLYITRSVFQGVLFRAMKRDATFTELSQGTIPGLNQFISLKLIAPIAAKGSLHPKAKRLSIRTLLFYTMHHQSTDPRDRIFAWYGIAKDLDIRPDYNKSLSEVYAAVTISTMLAEKNFGEWAWIGLNDRDPLDDLPSWVPDYHRFFGRTLNFLSPSLYNPLPNRVGANAPVIARQDSTDHRILHVSGYEIDSVTVISAAAPLFPVLWGARSGGNPDIIELLRTWKSVLNAGEDDLYPTGGTRAEAFWKTVLADIAVDGFHKSTEELRNGPVWHMRESGEASSRRLLPSDSHIPPARTKEESAFVSALSQQSRHFYERKMCSTSRGLMALVPPATKTGDIITVLRAGALAYVLRPIEQGMYSLVGEWYVKNLCLR